MTTYRKTDKGRQEVATRTHRLGPRLRSVLILVDGRRADNELSQLLPQQDFSSTMSSLLDDGFIEPVAGADAAGPQSSDPTGAFGAASSEKPSRRPTLSAGVLASLKRDAVRSLLDQVGPMGEAVAMKIERAADAEALEPLIDLAAQVLQNTRGTAAAQDYLTRYRPPVA